MKEGMSFIITVEMQTTHPPKAAERHFCTKDTKRQGASPSQSPLPRPSCRVPSDREREGSRCGGEEVGKGQEPRATKRIGYARRVEGSSVNLDPCPCREEYARGGYGTDGIGGFEQFVWGDGDWTRSTLGVCVCMCVCVCLSLVCLCPKCGTHNK